MRNTNLATRNTQRGIPMPSYLALTSEQVKKAVEAVKKSKPVYTEMLDFYAGVFDAQEGCKGRLQLEPLQLSRELRAARAGKNLPLVEIKDFIYDDTEAVNLFRAICELAQDANPKLSGAAEVLDAAVKTSLSPRKLFDGLLEGNEALFENVADELQVDKQIVGFITYNSLKPSLCACADQLAVYLNQGEPWLQGYCPICGSAPLLSMLEQEGRRKLVCGFCWHLWSAKRIHCPFCDCSQNKDLHYFYSEQEKDCRVDLCNNCKKYIKTIDLRKIDRLIYPPLEQLATMHLDLKARETGFEPGIRLFLQE